MLVNISDVLQGKQFKAWEIIYKFIIIMSFMNNGIILIK